MRRQHVVIICASKITLNIISPITLHEGVRKFGYPIYYRLLSFLIPKTKIISHSFSYPIPGKESSFQLWGRDEVLLDRFVNIFFATRDRGRQRQPRRSHTGGGVTRAASSIVYILYRARATLSILIKYSGGGWRCCYQMQDNTRGTIPSLLRSDSNECIPLTAHTVHRHGERGRGKPHAKVNNLG